VWEDIAPARVATPAHVYGWLAALFAVHVLARLITSPNAILDESEQLVFTQSLQWGYGPQPPLYTWLQWLIFKLTGPSILGLALLKNLLLFAAYGFTYATTRQLTRSHAAGVVAAFSLLFLPQMAWESQRDLTHSVLVTAVSAGTLWIFARIHRGGGWGWYAALGLALGLGHLSKHNYALFAAGLFFASLFVREFRSVVLTPRLFLALGLAVAVIWLHASWANMHRDLFQSSARTFGVQPQADWPWAIHAAGSLAGAWISHVCSLIVVPVLLCWREWDPFPYRAWRQPASRLLAVLMSGGLLCALAVMLGTHATTVKGRWVQPLFLCLPIWIASAARDRITRPAVQRVLAAATVVALAVLVALPVRAWYAHKFNRVDYINAPLREIAGALGPALARAEVVFSDSKFLAGNLRLIAPDKLYVVPGSEETPRPGSRALVVFDSTRRPAPSEAWTKLRGVLAEVDGPVNYVEAPFKGLPGQNLRVAFITGTTKGPNGSGPSAGLRPEAGSFSTGRDAVPQARSR